MAKLTALPEEISVHIYILCSDLRTAIKLSSANRHQRRIWADNLQYICRIILEHDLPTYEAALQLSIAEALCARSDIATRHELPSLEDLPALGDPQAPAHLILPGLIQNARMAEAVCSENSKWQDGRPLGYFGRGIQYTSWHASYYFLRKLALCYQYPQLKPEVVARLEDCSIETLHTHDQLCTFMINLLSHDEQLRHDIPKPDNEITLDDELNNVHEQPQWDQACDIIYEAWSRRGCQKLIQQRRKEQDDSDTA